MSLSVIDKYVAKKQTDLLEYSKVLESIISVDNNKMWDTKKEFSKYATDIIAYFTSEYYFQNNIHKDNPIEYSNDNINYVLKSIIEYCQKEKRMDILTNMKNETFLMSVIICAASYLDLATNIIDGDFSDTKAKFKYLLNYLAKTNLLIIKENKYLINDLFDLVKKNMSEDKKIVECLNSDTFYNEYKMVSNNPVFYLAKLHYEIPGLEDFDPELSKSVLKSYQDKFNELSLELLTYRLLGELISNKSMPKYFVNINSSFKKASVLKLFSCKNIRDYIYVLIPYEQEIDYQNIIELLKKNHINIYYDYQETENINSSILENDMNLLVEREFLQNNEDNQLNFQKMGINFIVKNKEEKR
mgnify:CR=1 FL=1